MSNPIVGIIKRLKRQFVIRTAENSYRKGQVEIFVDPEFVRKYSLTDGVAVKGKVESQKGRKRLVSIDSLGGLDPDTFTNRPRFSHLVVIDPDERFDLGLSGTDSMRIIDLIAPIGKGTRQLILSPPKAGKTYLLEQMVAALHQCSPESRIIVLLIDERPEEVTQFRRTATHAEVVASTSDQTVEEHVELVELMLAHVQTELECGRDVVIMVDSLTRVARAFNSRVDRRSRHRGKTMSGGLETSAMEIPRRLFGLARNVENGGSATIIATCLVDTGSRMDQLIFEEFKGTGNSEVVLDRSLAEARIFPAIDIPASGTRKESKLYSPDHNRGLATLRRVLSSYGTKEALENLFKLLNQYPDNKTFLESFCRGQR